MARLWSLKYYGILAFLLSAVLISLVSANPLPSNGENAWGTLDLCTISEYYISTWNTCFIDKRTVRYERLPGSCIGPASFELEVSCDCQLQDYEPLLADPTCGIKNPNSDETATTTLIGWIPRPESRCNPNLEVEKILNATVTQANSKVIVNCPCNENLIASYTTSCDTITSLRNVGYYWVRPCMLTPRVRLPAPKFISCEFTCGEGYYFDSNDVTCYQCTAGTRSSSGLTFSEPWSKLPSNFSTECQGQECDAWGPHGNYISSGLNLNKKNVRSILNFSFEVDKPSARLSVTYRIVSPPDRDNFKIKIRGRTALVDSGLSPVWQTFSVVLEDFADVCPWNLRWMRFGRYHEYCLLRTKLSPSSAKMAEVLQENPRAFHFDQILIPQQSGCEWWAFDRPEYWKATDRVVVFVPIGDCPLEKKISYAQRSKMDALVIITEQFLHQINLPDPGENPSFPVYVLRIDMAVFLEEMHHRDTPWFEYKSIPDMGAIPIEFLYEKNDNSALSSGHVLVKEIYVSNPKDGLEASVCIACPPGTMSTLGSASCVKCPLNTFSSEYRSAECKPCPSGFISEEGSTSCVQAHECALDDYFPVEDYPCRLAAAGTRILERGISYRKVNPSRCYETEKSTKLPPARKLSCASCPDGNIIEFSGTCVPCENLMAPNETGDRCISCPPKKAVYPIRNYQGFHALRGSIPVSWSIKCESCTTVGWKFVPYHRSYNANDGNDIGTGLGVGGELFSEGVATLEIPFELIQHGDVYFTYSYNELFSNSDELSVVTFQIINPVEETPIAARLDNGAHNFGSYTSPRLHPGLYVARWTYLKDPSRSGSVARSEQTSTDRQQNSGFILQTLVFHGEKTGSGTCQECIIGHECETGILTPCAVGTFSNAGTEYKCVPCPANSVAEKASAKCVPCVEDTLPSEDKRVCILGRTIRRLKEPETHEYIWRDLPPMFGPYHLDLDQDASEVSIVANRKSEQTLFVLNAYTDPSFRSIVSRLPLDFNNDIYGPAMYVISSDNVMRIGDIKGIRLSEWVGANSTDHLSDNDVRNATLPFTDVIYETNQPCEVSNLHYSAVVRFHCNTTYSEPWISKAYYEPNKCTYNMHIHFQQACPACLRMHAVRSTSQCINGVHDVYTRFLSMDNYTCYDKRVLGTPEYSHDFCNISDQIESSANYIILFSCVLIFAVCILCYFAFTLYKKHQKLYETYHSLSGERRGGYHDEEMKSINAHVPPGVVID